LNIEPEKARPPTETPYFIAVVTRVYMPLTLVPRRTIAPTIAGRNERCHDDIFNGGRAGFVREVGIQLLAEQH